MDLSTIIAKQKRIKTWSEFLEHIEDEGLRLRISDDLKLLRNSLAKCWEAQEITDSDRENIYDIERRLESSNELARMATHRSRAS